MAQVLTPIRTYLDRGVGTTDFVDEFVTLTDTDVQFQNDGNLVLFFYGATTTTVTLASVPDPYGRGGGGDNDETIIIPANTISVFPFMNPVMFNSGGVVNLSFTNVTAMDAGLYRLTKRA